ncbi:MAG: T9SS type A sorting domain-containing protein [Saprospiraceae bacterium]|nr:T9SS type A sorting domain-containing protein [Candidatus Vicinibacter affinis]
MGKFFINLFLWGTCLVLQNSVVYAQIFQWVNGFGSAGDDTGYGTTLDKNGNLYTVGQFTGTVDFDPGPGVFQLSSVGDRDIFISKMDDKGNFIWAKSIGGSAIDRGNTIWISPGGSVYVSGLFSGTADFDTGPGKFYLTAENNWDIFFAKYDLNGSFIWAKRIGGTSTEACSGITGDNFGNIYATGYFKGSVDFNPGGGINNLTSSNFSNDIFICKLDSSGNFLWAHGIGGTLDDNGIALALDKDNNIYFTGFFLGEVDFDPGSGVSKINATGGRDIFISKFDQTGKFIWAKGIGSSDDDQGRCITITKNNWVYISGAFSGTVDFDPGPLSKPLTSMGGTDIFLLKLDDGGNYLSAQRFGGSDIDQGSSIKMDLEDNVYVAGYFSNSVDFDFGTLEFILTSSGQRDLFILKCKADGSFGWALSAGGIGVDWAQSMDISSSGNIFITGNFEQTADFNRPKNANLVSNGLGDIFIARYDQCVSNSSTTTMTACDRFVWNAKSYTESGTYVFKTQNVSGCDSTATLFLTINKVDTSVTQVGTQLTANAVAAKYQWLDCNNNFSALPNENAKIFKAFKNGSYAVEIQTLSCVDTSDCYNVNSVGTFDEDGSNLLEVFPNPTGSNLTISFKDVLLFVKIEIFDLWGREINSTIYENSSNIFLSLNFDPGIYLLRINTGKHKKLIRVVKY